MVNLAGAEPGKTMLISDIAEQNGIPKKFLDTILAELKNAGLLHSKRGKGGGYALGHPAGEVRVGHINPSVDGPLAPISCASRTAYLRCEDCTDEKQCAVRLMMLEVRQAISTVLDNRRLAEMRSLADLDDLTFIFQI
jgi:Rrf2 family protein